MHPIFILPSVTTATFVTAEGVTTAASPHQEWVVTGDGELLFDFSEELPAYFEIDCVGDTSHATLLLGISEHLGEMKVNVEAASPLKTCEPLRFGDTLRLELNEGLTEGVRFATVRFSTTRELRFSNPRLICAPVTLPVTAFDSGDDSLNAIWDAGVRTLRNHVRQDHLSAILVDRGDRFAWSLDYYCAQKSLLAICGDADLAVRAIEALRGVDHGIYSYRLYWVLSVIDLIDYGASPEIFDRFIGDCLGIVEQAIVQFDDLPPLLYVSIDERLGGAFEEPDIPEAQRFVRALIVETAAKLATTCKSMHRLQLARDLQVRCDRLSSRIRGKLSWPNEWGTVSLAQAIVAGIPSGAEIGEFRRDDRWYSDSALSPSPPTQLVILEALWTLGLHDRARDVVVEFWGGQLFQGATNYFECFRPFWRHDLATNEAPPCGVQGVTSASHAWGSAISGWLTQHLAGVVGYHGGILRVAQLVPHSEGFAGSIMTSLGEVSLTRDEQGNLASIVQPVDGSAKVETLRILSAQPAFALRRLPSATVTAISAQDWEAFRLTRDHTPEFVTAISANCGAQDDRLAPSVLETCGTGSSKWDQFTLTIDIETVPRVPFTVELIVPPSSRPISQSIEFFDLTSREALDRGTIVRRESRALAVSILAENSVRIRVSHHAGGPAVVAGVRVTDLSG